MKFPQIVPAPFLALCALSLLGVSAAQAQTFLFDFGAGGTTTLGAEDPLNTWNNITDGIAANANLGQLLNVVTTTNEVSNIDFLMVSRFGGSNTNGTLASTAYVSEATRDSLYGHTEFFAGDGLTDIFPAFKFAELDLTKTYNFTFYASRTNGTNPPLTDNRETLYTITGGISGSTTLNAANNVDTTASVFGITPDANGEILINLTAGTNNNNANHFTYLGVMELTAVPEPTSALMMLSGVGMLGMLRRRRA